MRKMFAFIVLAFLASAIPASAQYIPTTINGWWYKIQGNQVMMLEADNLGLVNQLQREGYRNLQGDLHWNGNAYGLPMANGGFYPMYDRNRQPLSGRQRIERGAGIVAAADGVRRIINNPRGAAGWIEAAVGGVLMNDSRYRSQPKNQRDNGTTIVTPPPSGGQPKVYWSHGAPVAVGTRPYADMQAPVRPVIEKRSGEFTISNSTRFKMDVYDGDTSKEENFQFRMAPGEKHDVDAPGDRYRGLALVPNVNGSISTEEFKVSPTDAGWIFIEPDVMKGR